jgi:cell division protein FtsI/penicillin-binding protein 2
MPNKSIRRRCLVVLVALVVAFVALGARLFHVQVFQHDFFLQRALALHERDLTLYPARGRILDCNGKVLAMSEPTKIISVNPEVITNPRKTKDPDALVARLAEIIAAPTAEIARKAFAEGTRNKWILRDAPDVILDQIRELQQDRVFFEDVPPGDPSTADDYSYSGIVLQDRVRRVYPNGTLLAHVLGTVRDEKPEEQELGYAVRDDAHPVAGTELAADDWLTGRPGWRVKNVDQRWREVLADAERGEPATDGLDAVLTIDLNVQAFVEQEIARAVQTVACDSVTVIVLRPQTGEILALANWPTFDPNRLTEQTRRYTANPAIEEVFEPGSTLKPVTAVLALEYGTVTLDTEFYCEHGAWRTPVGRVLHDAHAYDTLNVFNIIAKSSNIGISKVAATLGTGPDGRCDEALAKRRLEAGLRAFGFGRRTGVPLPIESPGLLRPLSDWSGYSMTSLPMGHEIGVTPLQLALAYGAIANGGNLMEPRLLACLKDKAGHVVRTFPPKVVRRVVSERATREVSRALQGVVTNQGTARRADIPGFTQAGKTGTSQKVVGRSYSDTHFDSTFIGFAPVAQPELVIMVTMRGTVKPHHYAGTVAAPVFAAIGREVLEYLEVPPDELDAETDADSHENGVLE